MATMNITYANHSRSIPARKKTGLLNWLVAAESRYRQRQVLLDMTGPQLVDLGITRTDARIEADRLTVFGSIPFGARG